MDTRTSPRVHSGPRDVLAGIRVLHLEPAMRYAHVGEGAPCPRCLKLALVGHLRDEPVMPLHPQSAMNALAHDGSGKCCGDCEAADNLCARGAAPSFKAARVVTANDRQKQLRLPGYPMGLVKDGIMRANRKGDFERHLAWLKDHVWPLTRDEEEHTRQLWSQGGAQDDRW